MQKYKLLCITYMHLSQIDYTNIITNKVHIMCINVIDIIDIY